MQFKPIVDMINRINVAREESDTALFFELMYIGELVMKLIVLGLTAAIENEREKYRIRQLHKLVRADGLGEWYEVLEDVLTGPSSQYLQNEAKKVERRELTMQCTKGSWQYDTTFLINRCLSKVDPEYEQISSKISVRQWFAKFVRLRNITRGHGAPKGGLCSKLCRDLEDSIALINENFNLFKREWVFLRRNLNGKYRVTTLTEDASHFEYLKSNRTTTLADGVYTHYDDITFIELLYSDPDASDFFFPNGGYNAKKFDLISYISDSKKSADAKPYLIPVGTLPGSETEGIGVLDVCGQCFANLPPSQKGYVRRNQLEDDLHSTLVDLERHPIVTLWGRGGIGKTWLALTVLHQIARTGKLGAIFWFSARDIDLRPEGPKLVSPHVLTEKEIVEEFVSLMRPKELGVKGFKPSEYFAKALHSQFLGWPCLFVFDNFETVRNPLELFSWIDNCVRLPNKVLITCRIRDFKADFPVEVTGMTDPECAELINVNAKELGIEEFLTTKYRRELVRESEGHPYIIKILLGEIHREQRPLKVKRIVASKDDILIALFERTYDSLSPAAKRIFLALCNWHSTIPQLAVEAVLLRPENEKMDVTEAIQELRQKSLLEDIKSEKDESTFLKVPLAASEFGKRKLKVSPIKTAVEADTELLHYFGAAQAADVKHGFQPRIKRMFQFIAHRTSRNKKEISRYIPIIEFIARQYSPAWLLLASLYEESEIKDALNKAKDAVRRYIETTTVIDDLEEAWRKYAALCKQTKDHMSEAQSYVEITQIPNICFDSISDAASRLNHLFKSEYISINKYEKEILFKKVMTVMEERIDEGDSTDCSTLSWLCMHLHKKKKAKVFTKLGLEKESSNEYCLRLAEILNLT